MSMVVFPPSLDLPGSCHGQLRYLLITRGSYQSAERLLETLSLGAGFDRTLPFLAVAVWDAASGQSCLVLINGCFMDRGSQVIDECQEFGRLWLTRSVHQVEGPRRGHMVFEKGYQRALRKSIRYHCFGLENDAMASYGCCDQYAPVVHLEAAADVHGIDDAVMAKSPFRVRATRPVHEPQTVMVRQVRWHSRDAEPSEVAGRGAYDLIVAV